VGQARPRGNALTSASERFAQYPVRPSKAAGGSRLFESSYELEVFDPRERLVEVVEESAPLVIFGRAAKTFGVIFKALPETTSSTSRARFSRQR
jgi:hypothetical protein